MRIHLFTFYITECNLKVTHIGDAIWS